MKERIGYFDAMRGLAMLLVVVGHVFYFSFADPESLFFKVLSSELEIPLLFMVSGFLIRVPEQGIWRFLGKKGFMLCIPAAIFMTAYVWVTGGSQSVAWFDSSKDGYWFTFSLFQFIALFTVITLLVRTTRINRSVTNTLLLIVSVIILFGSLWCERYSESYPLLSLFGLAKFKWFIYFVFGSIIAESGILTKEMSDKEVKWGGVILAVCLLLHLYTYKGGGINSIGSLNLWIMICTLTALIVVLMGFRRYTCWSESRIGHKLQSIGRYSLDVYFIHYFFLPRNLPMVGEWFRVNSNPILEFAAALAIAAAVIAASLLVGRLIRLNPTLARWLLAAK